MKKKNPPIFYSDNFIGKELPIKAKNESKHTPGPWKLEGSDSTEKLIYCPADQNVIAYMAINKEHGTMANGHLIEAAPDMLFELQNFVDNVIEDPKIAMNQISYFKGRFRKAISKAQPKQ